jgi:DNA-binding protein HU-beta
MNKADLVDHVARRTGLTKRDARAAVEETFAAIRKNTKKGVQLAGFGSFQVVRRKARMGRNPQTGEAIRIKPSRGVRFKPATAYKSEI